MERGLRVQGRGQGQMVERRRGIGDRPRLISSGSKSLAAEMNALVGGCLSMSSIKAAHGVHSFIRTKFIFKKNEDNVDCHTSHHAVRNFNLLSEGTLRTTGDPCTAIDHEEHRGPLRAVARQWHAENSMVTP